MSELYNRMKARGINMSWYEKGKRGRNDSVIPLEDEQCTSLSIYLLKEDGSLWTITTSGRPYHKVRPGTKELPKSIYLCMCCKKQWDDAPMDFVNSEGEIVKGDSIHHPS